MKSLENCKSINILRRVALLCILELSGLMQLINISHELFWDGIKRLFVLMCVLVRDQSGADRPHCPAQMCGESTHTHAHMHTRTHTHTHTHTHSILSKCCFEYISQSTSGWAVGRPFGLGSHRAGLGGSHPWRHID